jgi:hypothetical protein
LLALLAAAGTARADPIEDEKVEAGLSTYLDQLSTVILSPFARAGATMAGGFEINTHWNADIISSASVDVITAATDSIEERRNELGLGVRHEKWLAGTDLEAAYAFSFENDGHSHILTAGAKRGFDQDNYEVSLTYGLSLNQVGVANEPAATRRSKTVHTMHAGLTRLINARTLVELVYSLYWARGYQASPYRRVPIETSEDLRGAIWVDELVPERRWRNAATGRLQRAVGSNMFAFLQYRLYADDWGVTGHTERFALAMQLTRALSVRFQQRAALQSGASFYQEHYLMETRYRTRDRRLSPHLSGMAGAAVFWEKQTSSLFGLLRLRLGYDALAWRFAEFSAPRLSITSGAGMEPLGWVFGHVVQVGVEARP